MQILFLLQPSSQALSSPFLRREPGKKTTFIAAVSGEENKQIGDQRCLGTVVKREVRGAHLDNLLSQCECVDDAYPSCSAGENTDTVLLIFPPWLAKVVGPVRARTGGWDVDKPPHGSVGGNAACQGIDVGF